MLHLVTLELNNKFNATKLQYAKNIIKLNCVYIIILRIKRILLNNQTIEQSQTNWIPV